MKEPMETNQRWSTQKDHGVAPVLAPMHRLTGALQRHEVVRQQFDEHEATRLLPLHRCLC
jgi:hypothetical protein